MATDFLGLQMVITLRSPGERLCGSVSGVEAGQSLTLRDGEHDHSPRRNVPWPNPVPIRGGTVWSLDTKQWRHEVILDPANIVDIVDAAKVPGASALVSHRRALSPSARGTQELAAAFADPAILSFRPQPREQRQPPPHLSAPGEQVASEPPRERASLNTISREATPSSMVRDRTEDVSIGERGSEVLQNVGVPASQQQVAEQKRGRTRRPSRGKRPRPGGTQNDRSPVAATTSVGTGQGWRQTPILKDTSSFQPFTSLRRGGRGQENGWASEDVTDVQEMGDFDFEEALSRFDKHTLFDQMRREDKVHEADRLVSHNRQTRPKSTNLQHWENVLDPPPETHGDVPGVKKDFWNSDADDEPVKAARESGSRQSSRRGEARAPVGRRSQSRKASTTAVAPQAPVRVHSGGVGNNSHQPQPRGRLGSARTDGKRPVPGFYLSASGRRVEAVSALQMLNLENIARDDLGLTEDMMTENSGRGIAEVVLVALADPAVMLRQAGQPGRPPPAVPNTGLIPTVVVLAGNNKSGSRAVAAARHLRNRRATVLVCVTGLERGERELLEDVRQQVRLFRAFGGHVYNKSELFEHLRKASILPTLTVDTPRHAATAKPPVVTVIVDALLGLAISFDELRTGDQTTVYELVEWANRNDAFVVAVDVPTGIDPSSGAASIVDGSRLYIRPRYVVAVGAPKRGLLLAVSGGDKAEDSVATEAATWDDSPADWRFHVADMGLGAAVWKKAGAKFRRGIDFDDKWTLEMKFQGAQTDVESLD